MKPRLLILVFLAVGVAIYWAKGVASPPVKVAVVSAEEKGVFLDGSNFKKIREEQELLRDRPLPGQEPPADPEFSIEIFIDPTDGKNRIYYDLSEAHDYYVETFRIRFWYLNEPDTIYEDSDLQISEFVNKYVEAKSVLSGCIEVVPAELFRIGGSIGTANNWNVEIVYYDRARITNPDPLPRLSDRQTCD